MNLQNSRFRSAGCGRVRETFSPAGHFLRLMLKILLVKFWGRLWDRVNDTNIYHSRPSAQLDLQNSKLKKLACLCRAGCGTPYPLPAVCLCDRRAIKSITLVPSHQLKSHH
uniref:Uncharacterized protein n=1 Tax=Clastoptera arizonana TaxID=38151 RepID=A0A1B6DSI1_9HEMI